METNTSLQEGVTAFDCSNPDQDMNIFLRSIFGSVNNVPTNEVKHCDSLICELELICKLDLECIICPTASDVC